jgi:hypothetical protein
MKEEGIFMQFVSMLSTKYAQPMAKQLLSSLMLLFLFPINTL